FHHLRSHCFRPSSSGKGEHLRVTESVDDAFARASGLRKRHCELRPEKSLLHTIGRGFDSRRLHECTHDERPPRLHSRAGEGAFRLSERSAAETICTGALRSSAETRIAVGSRRRPAGPDVCGSASGSSTTRCNAFRERVARKRVAVRPASPDRGGVAGGPRTAPSPPPADLPVDLRRIELLCARLRPEEGVELDRVRWAIAKLPCAEGWDNVLWPVGTLDGRTLVLRVARRTISRALLGREVTVLRRLRGLGIPLPMGLPTVLATAEDAILACWIPGDTADEAEPVLRARAAQDLTRMLAAVHSGPAPEVGRNPVRGVPL